MYIIKITIYFMVKIVNRNILNCIYTSIVGHRIFSYKATEMQEKQCYLFHGPRHLG